ncbi:MAG TPA: hydrogenase maturation protease [Rhodocyclaceae bacterium]|nr:hydrogenase maturation protease [Rhodocyclaceae bacterium]
MSRGRIIGLGSPFGDDRIGWAAAAALAPLCPGAEIILLDRPGAGLVHALAGTVAVLLVDGVRSGASPGTLHRLALADLLETADSPSSHHFGVADALGLAAALGQLPASLVLAGITIGEVDVGAGLSPALERRLPDLAEALAAEWRRLPAT